VRNRATVCCLSVIMLAFVAYAHPQNGISAAKFDMELNRGWIERVPPLYPAWTGSTEEGRRLYRSMGFPSSLARRELYTPVWDNPDKDPDSTYASVFPYPFVKGVLSEPVNLGKITGGGPGPSTVSLQAVRKHLRWRSPNDPTLGLEEWEEEVWQWKPPTGWGIIHESWSQNSGNIDDRYQAIVLSGGSANYRVACFDAVRGERWISALPVWEALERVQAVAGEPIVEEWRREHEQQTRMLAVWCAVTRDGNRALVAVGHLRGRDRCGLVFVFDDAGCLRRIRALPGRVDGIARHSADNLFMISLVLDDNKPHPCGRCTLLMDKDGNVLGRFAERSGEELRSVPVMLESDEIAWDGRFTAYYRLPKPGSRAY